MRRVCGLVRIVSGRWRGFRILNGYLTGGIHKLMEVDKGGCSVEIFIRGRSRWMFNRYFQPRWMRVDVQYRCSAEADQGGCSAEVDQGDCSIEMFS